jgi:hypothetical protein
MVINRSSIESTSEKTEINSASVEMTRTFAYTHRVLLSKVLAVVGIFAIGGSCLSGS